MMQLLLKGKMFPLLSPNPLGKRLLGKMIFEC